MAEFDLMAPGPLPGVPAHPPATLSPDSGLASPAEGEGTASLGSSPGESWGQSRGSAWQGRPGAEVEEEEEVLCDFCLGANRVRAMKSCLTCMVNYCPEHLRPHQENSRLQGHQLAEPVKDRDLLVCLAHRSPLVAFCCPDGQCICQECGRAEHRGHASVSLDAAHRDKEASAGVRAEREVGRPWVRERPGLCLGSWGCRLHYCALSFGPWLCSQRPCLLHLALETGVGYSVAISVLLSLYSLCLRLSLLWLLSCYFSLSFW